MNGRKDRSTTSANENMDRASKDARDVGYGRPPVEHRFKRGQSGNPKGRPKKAPNARTIMNDVLHERIPVQGVARAKRMPAVEVLIRKTFHRALNGNEKANAMLLNQYRQFGCNVELDKTASEPFLGIAHEEIVADFIARHMQSDSDDAPSTSEEK